MARSFSMRPLGSYERTDPNGVKTSFTGLGIWSISYSLSRADVIKGSKSAGWRPPNPYFTEVDLVKCKGRCESGDRYTYDGDLGWMIGVDRPSLSPWKGGLRSKAEVEALTRLKDQKVNLAQFFAERKMTERLLLDTMGDIAQAVRSTVRGDPRGVEKALRLSRRASKADKAWKRLDPTQRWLEYQYGWVPLLSDVHGAAEALRNSPRDSMRKTCKGNGRFSWNEVVTTDGGRYGLPLKRIVTHTQEVKVSLTYIPNANWYAQVMASTGFSNPLALQWELVPFSFVADWFLPIGNWLNSLDATSGYDFLGGSRTEYRDVRSKYVSYKGSEGRSIIYEGFDRRMRFDRYTYASSPLPARPSVQAPWAVNGANRFANAMSLLRQAFKG